MLLLNDEAMEQEKREDFERLLEKAIDTSIVFAPTAEEAARIAIVDDEPVGALLRGGVVALGITNIRVIKKIERLAHRLAGYLQPYRPEVLTQAVTACLLSGWAVFERDHAPPMEFIQSYNALIAAMQDRDNDPTDEIVRWRDQLSALPFSHPDDFDRTIFEGVSAGYFDEARLLKEAKILEEALNRNSRDNSFARAWDRYHESLTDDDEVVLDTLYQSAMENLAKIDSLNINGTILFLREFGRNDEADELARAYTAAQPDDPHFFDLCYHHFSADAPVDPALHAAFETRRAGFKDERDPKEVLLAIGRGEPWQDEDVRLLAGVTPDAFEAMIEETEGKDLRLVVQSALQIAARHEHEAPNMKSSLQEALRRIAGKSPMRARRLRAWGYKAPTAEE